jgi:hypothetical protein
MTITELVERSKPYIVDPEFWIPEFAFEDVIRDYIIDDLNMVEQYRYYLISAYIMRVMGHLACAVDGLHPNNDDAFALCIADVVIQLASISCGMGLQLERAVNDRLIALEDSNNKQNNSDMEE